MKCFLVCKNRSHDPIPLPDKTPVLVGRSPMTKIADPRCSRNQLELTADYSQQMVKVKQLGLNYSSVDGSEMKQGMIVQMDPKSTLHVLSGQYIHELKYEGVISQSPNKNSEHKKISENMNEKCLKDDSFSKSRHSTGRSKEINETGKQASKHSSDSSLKTKHSSTHSNSKHGTSSESKDSAKNSSSASAKDTKYTKHTEDASQRKKDGSRHSSGGSDVKNTQRHSSSKHSSSKHASESLNASKECDDRKRKRGDSSSAANHKHSSSGETVTKKTRIDQYMPQSTSTNHKDKNGDSDSDHQRKVQDQLQVLKASAHKQNQHAKDVAKSGPKPAQLNHGGEATENKWEEYDRLCVYTSKGLRSSSKVAGFDIDGTIVGTESGKVFPVYPGDWKILYGEISGKLKKFHEQGFKIVFFTNQLGVQRGKTKLDDLKYKFSKVVEKVGVPVQIFISTGSGIYRKPGTGMWKFLIERANDGIDVELAESIYVGDAAGRPVKWSPGKKKDFSCGDRLFALNLGLKFYTPEEFFLGYKAAPYSLPEFNPRNLKEGDSVLSPRGAAVISGSREVIVTVGFPASGKSFFVKEHLVSQGYAHISRDAMGSWQKCVVECDRVLKLGKCVVVDNTSPDIESRKRYIDVCDRLAVPCRCFHFTATLVQARHNERFREMTDKSHQSINDMIMNSYKSKFVEPTVAEGFKEVVKVNFVPNFKNSEHRNLYMQYLLEK